MKNTPQNFNENQFNENVDLFQIYMKEISRYPLLSKEKEKELGEILITGNFFEKEQAKKEFILSNLKLVVHIANQYHSSIPILDIIQEGNLGLIHAVSLFDYRKSKFTTYAGIWIHNYIKNYLRNQGLIYIPTDIMKEFLSYKKIEKQLLNKNIEPSSLAISNIAKVSEKRVKKILSYDYLYFSLSDNVNNESKNTFLDFLSNDSCNIDYFIYEKQELKQIMFTILHTLPIKESFVIKQIYGFQTHGKPLSLSQVCALYTENFGEPITKETIRQIRNRGLEKIMKNKDILYDFYENSFQ